jgi:hypothetical protein
MTRLAIGAGSSSATLVATFDRLRPRSVHERSACPAISDGRAGRWALPTSAKTSCRRSSLELDGSLWRTAVAELRGCLDFAAFARALCRGGRHLGHDHGRGLTGAARRRGVWRTRHAPTLAEVRPKRTIEGVPPQLLIRSRRASLSSTRRGICRSPPTRRHSRRRVGIATAAPRGPSPPSYPQ